MGWFGTRHSRGCFERHRSRGNVGADEGDPHSSGRRDMTIERDGSGNRYVDAGNIRVTFVEQSSWTESDGELARPGGNTTGISILATELDGKRQEILMEMVPADNEMAVRFRGSSRPHA
jgi:hypothetical protein